MNPSSVWRTPPAVVAQITKALGGSIGVDPCTDCENPTGAFRFYSHIGLDTWHLAPGESVYVNYPGGRGNAQTWWSHTLLQLHDDTPVAFMLFNLGTIRALNVPAGWHLVIPRKRIDFHRPTVAPGAAFLADCRYEWTPGGAPIRDNGILFRGVDKGMLVEVFDGTVLSI